MGYLVCDSCGSYYEMGADETPNDFTDECDCGGKLQHQKSLHPEKEDDNKFWRSVVASVFMGFVLIFAFKVVVASLIAGAVMAYGLGGGYKDGAKNGFITGALVMLLFMLTALIFAFTTRNINLEFSMIFSYGLGLVILFTGGLILIAGAIAAVGGLIGVKIRKIREKYE